METKASCLTAWLNGFSGMEESDLAAYRDGAILLCVAQDVMEGLDFSSIPDDLSGVLSCIEHSYQRTFPDVDTTKAAATPILTPLSAEATSSSTSTSSMRGGRGRDEDEGEIANLTHLVRLVSLLLAFTVQSSKKGDHIAAILALPEESQGCLMEIIETVLNEVSPASEDVAEEEEEEENTGDGGILSVGLHEEEGATKEEATSHTEQLSTTVAMSSSALFGHSVMNTSNAGNSGSSNNRRSSVGIRMSIGGSSSSFSSSFASSVRKARKSLLPGLASSTATSSSSLTQSTSKALHGITSPTAQFALRAAAADMPSLASLVTYAAVQEHSAASEATSSSSSSSFLQSPLSSKGKRVRNRAFSPSGATPSGKNRTADGVMNGALLLSAADEEDGDSVRSTISAASSGAPVSIASSTIMQRNKKITKPTVSTSHTVPEDNLDGGSGGGGGGGRTLRQADAEVFALKEEVSDLRDEVERYKRRCATLSQAAQDANADAQAALAGGVVGGGGGGGARMSLASGTGIVRAVRSTRNTLGGNGGGRASLAGGDDILALMRGDFGGGRLDEEDEEEEDSDSESSNGDDGNTFQRRQKKKSNKSQPQQQQLQKSLSSLNAELVSVREKLAETESQLKQTKLAATKTAAADAELLSKLRDEVDILRPAAAAKDRAEASVERLKKKVDSFGNMKESLKKTEIANTELTSRVLDLEREAAKVAPLRALLEETRDCRAVAEVKVSELEQALLEAQATCEELRSALNLANESSSSSGDFVAFSGISELASLGIDTFNGVSQDGTISASSTNGGNGLSEFNPDMAQRVASLERENAELRAAFEGGDALPMTGTTATSSSGGADGVTTFATAGGTVKGPSSLRIAKLEADLDDTRRIKAAFESKFLQMKTKATELDTNLTDAKHQITLLDSDIKSKFATITTLTTQIADLKASLDASSSHVSSLTASLAEEKATHAANVSLWTGKFEDKTGELAREKAAHLQSIERAQTEAERNAHAHSEALASVRHQLNDTIADAAARAEQAMRAHEYTLQTVRSDAAASASAAGQRLQDALTDAANRAEQMLRLHEQTVQSLRADAANAAESAAKRLQDALTDAASRAEAVARSHELTVATLRADAVAAADAASQRLALAEAASSARLVSAQETASQQITSASEAAERSIAILKGEAERREATLKAELEAYKQAHSMSDSENIAKMEALEEDLRAAQANIQGLEAQKSQGLSYLSSLQERIRNLEAESIAFQEEASNELDILSSQLEASKASEEESIARVALLETRLLEARKENEASREKAVKMSRELAAVVEANGGGSGGSSSSAIATGGSRLKDLQASLEALVIERESVARQLTAALTHMQNLGYAVPPCILDGIVPDPHAHGGSVAFTSTTTTGDAEAASIGSTTTTTGTRARRQAAASEASKASTGTGARRVLRSASSSSGDGGDGSATTSLSSYSSSVASDGGGAALMVAEMRSVLAARESDVLRAQAAIEEQRQLRLQAEIKAEELADSAAALEKRLTRAALQSQRLVKALEEAGVHVMNADTGDAVLGEDGAVDLNGSLVIGESMGGGYGYESYYDGGVAFTNGGGGAGGGDDDDDFLPADRVIGNTNNNVTGSNSDNNTAGISGSTIGSGLKPLNTNIQQHQNNNNIANKQKQMFHGGGGPPRMSLMVSSSHMVGGVGGGGGVSSNAAIRRLSVYGGAMGGKRLSIAPGNWGNGGL